MQTLLDCVVDGLTGIGRPVCQHYATVGTPVISSCCECEEGTDGEVSIHLRRMFEADSSTLAEVRRVRPCRGGTTAATFRVVIARCFPTIGEDGELPDPTALEAAKDGQLADVNALWYALACCTGLTLSIDDVSPDLNPMGGCSLLWADVTALVHVSPPTASA